MGRPQCIPTTTAWRGPSYTTSFDDTNPGDPLCGIDRSPELRWKQVRRGLLYMLLIYAKDLADHAVLARRIEDVYANGAEEEKEYLQKQRDFCERQNVLLERFRRYPHRNQALGRATTEEVRKFLEKGGYTIGTKTTEKSTG